MFSARSPVITENVRKTRKKVSAGVTRTVPHTYCISCEFVGKAVERPRFQNPSNLSKIEKVAENRDFDGKETLIVKRAAISNRVLG